MSRNPWSPIQREAHRWRNESSQQANQRTLGRIEAAENHRNLLRDITKLAIIEGRYPEQVSIDPESGAARIPCPVCKSTKYLIESFRHPSILICERPNCIYKRAIQRRDELVRETEPLLKAVK